jgi:Photosystem I psaA/psaB protein
LSLPQLIGPAVDISASQITPSLSIDSGPAQPVQFPLWPSFEHLSSLVFASLIGTLLLQFRLDVCPRALPIAAYALQFAAQVGPDCASEAGELVPDPSARSDNRGGNTNVLMDVLLESSAPSTLSQSNSSAPHSWLYPVSPDPFTLSVTTSAQFGPFRGYTQSSRTTKTLWYLFSVACVFAIDCSGQAYIPGILAFSDGQSAFNLGAHVIFSWQALVNHHLGAMLGTASLAWAGHFIHVALPVSRGVNIDAFQLAVGIFAVLLFWSAYHPFFGCSTRSAGQHSARTTSHSVPGACYSACDSGYNPFGFNSLSVWAWTFLFLGS